jgi:hypothetical protein
VPTERPLSAPFPPSSGGESAVVGSATPFGDYEQAGTYFVEVFGTSGLGTLRLAIDGNVTTLAVPRALDLGDDAPGLRRPWVAHAEAQAQDLAGLTRARGG